MKLQRDLALLAASIILAVALGASGTLEQFLVEPHGWGLIGAFVAGIGFASAFFAAPATVTLFTLAEHFPFWLVAALGAAGAMLGDWLIFRFFRDGIADDFRFFLEQSGMRQRFGLLVRSRMFYWVSSFIAAMVIASPLPDEIGLAMFGMLRFNTKRFLPISFALNFLGILIITLLAKLP